MRIDMQRQHRQATRKASKNVGEFERKRHYDKSDFGTYRDWGGQMKKGSVRHCNTPSKILHECQNNDNEEYAHEEGNKFSQLHVDTQVKLNQHERMLQGLLKIPPDGLTEVVCVPQNPTVPSPNQNGVTTPGSIVNGGQLSSISMEREQPDFNGSASRGLSVSQHMYPDLLPITSMVVYNRHAARNRAEQSDNPFFSVDMNCNGKLSLGASSYREKHYEGGDEVNRLRGSTGGEENTTLSAFDSTVGRMRVPPLTSSWSKCSMGFFHSPFSAPPPLSPSKVATSLRTGVHNPFWYRNNQDQRLPLGVAHNM